MRKILLFFIALCAVWLPETVKAQISVTACGPQPVQNFNGLTGGNSGGCANTFSFNDNVTLPGWYKENALPNPHTAIVSNGNCTTAGFYSFGTSFATDRAFGTLVSGATQNIGVRYVNNTGGIIGSVTITYTGEAWRTGDVATPLLFAYRIGGGSLSSGAWTNVAALNFVPPMTVVAPPAPLNGNLAANRATLTQTIFGVNIPVGAEFWVRWQNNDVPVLIDPGLAIDDYTITFGPTLPTIAAPATPVCNNANQNYSVVNMGYNYNWTISPTRTLTNANTPLVTVDFNGAPAGTYTLTVTASDGGACTNFRTQNVTVSALNGGTIASDRTYPVCENNTNSVLTLSGHSGTVLQWESSTDNFATVTVIPNVTATQTVAPTVTTRYRARIQSPAPCPVTISNFIEVTVDPNTVAGSISADATFCQGSPFSHAINLTGQTGTVQRWEFSTDGGLIWSTINNTTPTLTVDQTVITQTAQFRAFVKSGVCPEEETTPYVTVTLNPPPVATPIFLTSNQTICAGDAVVASLNTGYVGNIQWEENPTCMGIYTPVVGETFETFTNNNLALFQTTCYRVRLSQPGCADVFTNEISVTVDPQPVAGTFTLNSNNICVGQTTDLTLAGHTGNIQWQWDNGCVGNYINIGNVNDNPYNTVFPVGSHCLRALIASPLNACPSLTSSVQVLQVNVPPVPGTASVNVTAICGGQPVTFNLTGSSGAIQWQEDPGCTGTWSNIAGANSPNYISTGINVTTCIRAEVTNPGCPPLYSNQLTINSVPASVGGTLTPGSQTICLPAAPITLTLNGFTGTILRWESSTNNFVNANTINNVTNQLTVTPVSNISYRVVVQNGGCVPAFSDVVNLTVGVSPIAGTITRSQTICAGTVPSVLLLTGSAGGVFQWESAEDVNFTVNAQIIANTTTLLRPAAVTTTTYFRAVVGNMNCGFLLAPTVEIRVNPRPGGTLTDNQTICSGAIANPLFLNLTGGTVTRWESSNDNFLTVMNINVITNFYDPGVVSRTTQYRALISSPGCASVYSNSVTVTVQTPPVPGFLSTGGSFGSCTGGSALITLTGSQGTIVRWEKSTDNFVSIIVPISNFTNVLTVTPSGNEQYRVVLQNAPCAFVYSNVVSISGRFTAIAQAAFECNNRGKITAIGSGGTPPYTYFLTPNSGIQSLPGVFTNVVPGTYTVTVRDRFNCTATATVRVPSQYSAPTITSIQGAGEGQAVVAWSEVSPGANAVLYQVRYRIAPTGTWTTLPRTAATSQLITMLMNGVDYQVQVRVLCVARNIWSAWSLSTTFRAGGLREEAVNTEVKISPEVSLFPNPNKGDFNLNIRNYAGQAVPVEIFDLTGKRIYASEFSSDNIAIDLGNPAAGVYLMKVTIDGEAFRSKFIVE